MIEEGRKNMVINGIIEKGCKVNIMKGMKEKDVK